MHNMGKARRNLNFRETSSERSATSSYRSFGKYRKTPNQKFNPTDTKTINKDNKDKQKWPK